jgi:hypothetical protein
VITFVTIPKPFAGHIGMIQSNAVGSWLRVADRVQVVLAGDEDGVAAAAKAFGVEHEPSLERNAYGTPLVSDAVRLARERAEGGPICFVNADILLPPTLARAGAVAHEHSDRFLVIGETRNANVDNPLDPDALDWPELLRGSHRRGADAIDYFLFAPDLYPDIPPFAVGRPAWDNWLIWKAREEQAVVVDATRIVKPIHQNHDYAHIGGRDRLWAGEEAAANRRLAGGGRRRLYSRLDATHRLTGRGLVPNPLAIGHAGETARRGWAKLEYTLGFRHA